jgi:hypothetical protein
MDAPPIGGKLTILGAGNPGEAGWSAIGDVLALAPYSVLVGYIDGLTGEAREDWFRLRGAIRHGDTNDGATTFQAVVC